ncbi:DUF4112 domain-containing protein [Botrimarina sp.]|uniref:DUF4112 domain-containing protein n=1 Tax=Botrimarina sp. TaxID=2795802 RepID=UPI0032ECBDAD
MNRGPRTRSGKLETESARRLAYLLDDVFRIPGTNIRFGWDSIIGLVPGVGDAATTLIALAPVATAWKLGGSRWLIARMLGNVAIDATVGAIPLAGDAFDLFFKANRRNARMLEKFVASTTKG